ncbi:hypothetical protein [Methylorubrum populi]|uniref:hypothetical protein n=1 Tax=Methylorubrum populi TaxID=223967 RepID=UPI0012FFC701|nr:hypothetical protein [Methylorubrum populi]
MVLPGIALRFQGNMPIPFLIRPIGVILAPEDEGRDGKRRHLASQPRRGDTDEGAKAQSSRDRLPESGSSCAEADAAEAGVPGPGKGSCGKTHPVPLEQMCVEGLAGQLGLAREIGEAMMHDRPSSQRSEIVAGVREAVDVGNDQQSGHGNS